MLSFADLLFTIFLITDVLLYWAWSVHKERRYFNAFLAVIGLLAGYSLTSYYMQQPGNIAPKLGEYIYFTIAKLPDLISNVSDELYVMSSQGFNNPVLDTISIVGMITYSFIFLAATFAAGTFVKLLTSIVNLLKKK